MYKLLKSKKSDRLASYDYVFKDFKSFYAIAQFLKYPISGIYSIAIKSDQIEDIREFLKVEQNYQTLDISIFTSQNLIDVLQMYDSSVRSEEKSMYDVLVELIQAKGLLFDKFVISTLYSSIEHDVQIMEETLSMLRDEYGEANLITENMLSRVMIINKFVYPRSVLLSYLKMDKKRQTLLNMSVSQFGVGIVTGAMRKNIKLLFKSKTAYLKSGSGTSLIKSLSTSNITAMYNVLCLQPIKINDPFILMALYERNDVNDLLFEQCSRYL